ncbi:MAG: fibronectin type III domain-containing protein [Patescibacteria group bacterium]|nr:fibronectin type III domain-containing protein [Patescibacteria group bacterium]MDD5295212.1 fibronectin type III domain-containing protein [Patescibacteria group bacterium]MDD5554017.1 fibronectin type III domain-containing protein [Patescibacteria group bacterium]
MTRRKIFFVILPFLFFLPFLVEARINYSPNLRANDIITSDTLGINWYATRNEQYGIYLKKEGTYEYAFVMATGTPPNLTLPIVYYKSNLDAGTLYSFKVKACDAEYADSMDCFASESKCLETVECLFSDPLSLTTYPGKPSLDYEKSATLVNLSWTAVKGATLYQIGYKKAIEDEYGYRETSQREYAVSGLVPDTDYNFKIQACGNGVQDTDLNREYDRGCSGFGRVISVKTLKEQTIVELEGNYEKKNSRLQKTLTGYLTSINKYENLASATRSDFINEITNDGKNGVLDLLAGELASVKTETNGSVIEAKIADLDATRRPQLEILSYKLKILKKCDGYYKKFSDWRAKVESFLEIPATAKDDFLKAGGYMDKVKENYQNNYENAILAGTGRLPVATTNLTGSLAFIKTLYENINKDKSYKTAEVVYKTFYNVSKINTKLESFKEYAHFDNKKWLVKAFSGYYPSGGENVLFADKYEEMLDDLKNYYQGYVANKRWDSYDIVYGDYKHLRGNDKLKKAVTIANSLKKINSILLKTNDYYNKINGFSKISSEIKTKAGSFTTTISDKLVFNSSNPFTKKVLDNPDKATIVEINGYFGHKTFGYFYKGVKVINDFNIKIENLKKIVTAIGSCPAATGNINQAEAKRNLAEAKLKEFAVDNLEITKLKYSEFANFYQETLNYYKTAITEAQKCL